MCRRGGRPIRSPASRSASSRAPTAPIVIRYHGGTGDAPARDEPRSASRRASTAPIRPPRSSSWRAPPATSSAATSAATRREGRSTARRRRRARDASAPAAPLARGRLARAAPRVRRPGSDALARPSRTACRSRRRRMRSAACRCTGTPAASACGRSRSARAASSSGASACSITPTRRRATIESRSPGRCSGTDGDAGTRPRARWWCATGHSDAWTSRDSSASRSPRTGRSWHVMEKLGLTRRDTAHWHELDVEWWALDREDWTTAT